ncbi:acyl-CoA dehydrogenase family protein, partial [Mycobacterium colombiense]|uniref:acyl-CoA dehydrogenase family protein n=1 Tax=Mycobacterium colombiense TaxID=339268 RepID=UPI000AB80D55
MNVEQFRADLRAWLDDNDLTPEPDHSLQGHMRQFARVSRALYDADWMRFGWPVEVGGLGGPAVLRAIVGEEVVGRRLAEPGPYSMLEVLAPTMIDYAPAELAKEMVPRLLSGEEQWCQGFSEPGSGSDLASLTTRAVQDGDNWIVNGQKVWTSFAQFSTRCVLLTRTAPGHDGITAFFVDLDTPGITVRPLRTMHGVDEFCEVYYDDVVIPASRMLGKPGDGWRLAMDLLPYERSACFWQRIAYLYSRFDDLITAASETGEPDESALGGGQQHLVDGGVRPQSGAVAHAVLSGTRPAAQRVQRQIGSAERGFVGLAGFGRRGDQVVETRIE